MDNISPQLSIIVATYNSGDTLSKTLDSIISQSFQNWECIVVDGGSTDSTIDIIKEFEKKDQRIVHVSEPDNGIYDAFNKGWKLSKGEWIYYLGSSDILLPDGIAKMMEQNHNDAAIISGHVYAHMMDGTVKAAYSKGWGGSHQAKITRKSVIQQFGGFDESFRIVADEDLIWKIRTSGLKIDNVDVFVAVFYVDGLSSKLKSVHSKINELYRVYKKYPEVIPHPIIRLFSLSINSYGSIIYRKIRNIFMSSNMCLSTVW